MWNNRTMLQEQHYAIKMDITLGFAGSRDKRLAVGQTLEHEGRQWVVLRAHYVGDGLYSLRLGAGFAINCDMSTAH